MLIEVRMEALTRKWIITLKLKEGAIPNGNNDLNDILKNEEC